MRKITFGALIIIVLMSVKTWAQSSPPTGAKYIIITTSHTELKLDFAGNTDNTDVWVETSEGIYQHKTISTGWCGYETYTITSGNAKVFGDITMLDCGKSDNKNNKVTGLDFSNNNLLTLIYCSYNELTNLNFSGLSNLTTLACSHNQLRNLNFSGLSNLTKLDCSHNQLTSLDVSELSNLTSLSCAFNLLTDLGVSPLVNLTKLLCFGNRINSLYVSGLSNLTELSCHSNQLTSLNVSGLSNLTKLACGNNQLTSLNVSGLNNLLLLSCSYNPISSLNVSNLIKLTNLYCLFNQLTSLDVSPLSNLTSLNCAFNLLDSLNVSSLNNLINLFCYGNKFDTQDIDNIYCALPQRDASDSAKLYIADSPSDYIHTSILASNAQNARNKNWNVWYYSLSNPSLADTDVPTTGSYVCGNVSLNEKENAQVSIYPNPTNKEFSVKAKGAYNVKVMDISGRVLKEVKMTNFIKLNLSSEKSGVYFVQISDRTKKETYKIIKM